jgi:WhiB family transcriptional regulator, redox-sensing transcriptional regulator
VIDPALVELFGTKEPWQRDALCVEYPPGRPPPPPYQNPPDWFPERGASGWRGSPGDVARAVCSRCLVRRECLDYAIRNEITEGIWGGLTGSELREVA